MQIKSGLSSFAFLMLSGTAFALLSACSSTPKPLYQSEQFDSKASPFARNFNVSTASTCQAARRALLSQGYITSSTRPDLVDGTKNFQPDADSHVTIEFHVVCTSDDPDSANSTNSTAYVSAVQDRYTLKKTSTSASVGLSVLGSLSLPIGSSDDSMVKIASETIPAGVFYDRFFNLVKYYIETAPEKPAPAKPVAPPPPMPDPIKPPHAAHTEATNAEVATPVIPAPAGVAPANATPVNVVPANVAPANAAPANAAPANTAPANAAPANATPVNATPVNATPANTTPASAAPGSSIAPSPATSTPAAVTPAPAEKSEVTQPASAPVGASTPVPVSTSTSAEATPASAAVTVSSTNVAGTVAHETTTTASAEPVNAPASTEGALTTNDAAAK